MNQPRIVSKWPIAGAAAAAVYVAIFLFTSAYPAEGSWSGFLIFALGWPTTLIGLLISHGSSMIAIVVCGAIQWFLIGALAWSIVARIFSTAQRVA